MPEPEKHRNWWIWVSAALAVVVVGLLVWGLNTKSDLDSANDKLAKTEKELASAQEQLGAAQKDVEQLKAEQEQQTGRRTVLTAGTLATAKSLYDDLAEELGATQQDLDATKKDLEAANKKAKQAEEDAATAEKKADQADNATDKAEAEADQAQAELAAAESKASIVADCAKAYVSAFGGLFEGDDPSEQAPAVRDAFADITSGCKTALTGE
jgi:peptidoglycan hydrolase CwlO-like protein